MKRINNFIKRKIYDFVSGVFPRLLVDNQKYKLNKLLKRPNAVVHDTFLMGEHSDFYFKKNTGSLFIAKNVRCLKFCNFLLYPEAEITISENVFFNNYCSINALGKISIGENTIFGEAVKIYDHNHKHDRVNNILEVERDEFSIAPVSIGRNCWIGSNVTILKGVEIGDNVIVGANCLIYQSIPSNSIVKLKTELTVTPV